MGQGPEWHFAERPIIEHLQAMGYGFVPIAEHASLRDAAHGCVDWFIYPACRDSHEAGR